MLRRDRGVVYKLAPGTNGKWTSSVLHRFTDKNDGAEPNGAVIFDKTGKHLYGTAIFGEPTIKASCTKSRRKTLIGSPPRLLDCRN
jgi:hypothetical protein